MRFIADFHIHARYAHATSKHMNMSSLATWGQLKGIGVMGTGDFTHPLWQAELQEFLQESEPGLFTLKDTYAKQVDQNVYATCKAKQRFMLTGEISTIFKRNGRCYKLHSIILAPSFKALAYITKKLDAIGNIKADGRPILGLDVKDLLKIVLDASPECMLIPAHIWTPYFGLFGSKSGFNSIYDCFEEMTDYIYALETGLSSNYAMNARLSELDRFTLLCNSDAHSLPNLGREANVMHVQDFSYTGIINALRYKERKEFVAGIEFFPERGKYFGNGHRACNVCVTNDQVQALQGRCPKCKKDLTIGVDYRVEQLADRTREEGERLKRQCMQVMPLQDIISKSLGFAPLSKRVQTMYQQALAELGPEFYILLKAPIKDIEKVTNPVIAKTVFAIRQGEVTVQPGYDGVYGQLQLEV